MPGTTPQKKLVYTFCSRCLSDRLEVGDESLHFDYDEKPINVSIASKA